MCKNEFPRAYAKDKKAEERNKVHYIFPELNSFFLLWLWLQQWLDLLYFPRDTIYIGFGVSGCFFWKFLVVKYFSAPRWT